MRAHLTPEAIDSGRGRLVDVATRLFVENGADALSLRSLARALGVSRSTPYGYFASKQEIVDAIRAAGFDRLTARCARALEHSDDPLEQMRALGNAVVRFACDEPAVYGLMFSGPVFSNDVSAVLAAAVERFRAVSRPPLDTAIARGLVRCDPEHVRRLSWAAFHGLVTLHLQGHFDRERLLADAERLHELIGHGILRTA